MDDDVVPREKKSVKVKLISIIYAGIVVKSVKPYGTFFGATIEYSAWLQTLFLSILLLLEASWVYIMKTIPVCQ